MTSKVYKQAGDEQILYCTVALPHFILDQDLGIFMSAIRTAKLDLEDAFLAHYIEHKVKANEHRDSSQIDLRNSS